MKIKKTKRLYLQFMLITLTLAGIIGCGKNPKPQAGRGSNAPMMVEAIIIQAQPIENKIFTTGTLLANEEVELRPETSGRVTGVFFNEGKKVKKGELLLKINDRELQAQLKRKQLEEAFAADDEHRKQILLEKEGISREEYDQALKALNMIKAEREVIESQIAETEIIAPFDGIIGLRYVSEGSYISPSTLVATMQDIDPIKVEFSVPEKYARQMTQNIKTAIQVGDSPAQYAGAIYAVESKVDPATRTLKARATVPNPQAALMAGLFAKVEIVLEQIPDALMIPAEALIPELTGEKVFICTDGKARSVPVTTGLRTEKSIQITQGLSPDDTLITTGLLQLTDGKPVQLKNLPVK